MFDLSGKVVAITGGGSGIGKAIAQIFAKQGALVEILDLDLDVAQQAADEINVSTKNVARAHQCDVSNLTQVTKVFEDIEKKHSKLTTLVNNAGIAHVGNIEKTSEEDFDRIYSVNVRGIFHCLKAAVPLLKKNGGGAIVNLASIASLKGLKDRFAYSMSKGAVLTMTYSIATDYVADKIRCNCICPARIHTPFVDGFLKKAYPGREKEMFETLSRFQPVGRMGTPDEVAALALYLCADESSFVTGSAYPIDGGVLGVS